MSTFVEDLSPKQRNAYLKVSKLLADGFTITEAARKTKVKASDYNNARNRLTELERKTDTTWTDNTDKEETTVLKETEATSLNYFFEINPGLAVTLASNEATVNHDGGILRMTRTEFFNLVKFYNILERN